MSAVANALEANAAASRFQSFTLNDSFFDLGRDASGDCRNAFDAAWEAFWALGRKPPRLHCNDWAY